MVSDPKRDAETRSLMALIGNLRLLPRQVSLAEMRAALPEWPFVKAPRQSMEVPADLVESVVRLLGGTEMLLDVDQAFLEGEPQLATHIRYERNRALIVAKRRDALRTTGELRCEACGFSFPETYGELGRDFCEVHHLIALSAEATERSSSLDELAILCSNCHRMIHKSQPMLSVAQLRNQIKR